MEPSLQQNPLWPGALGALRSHLQDWWDRGPAPRPGSRAWSALAADLNRLGLDRTTRDSLLAWAGAQTSRWGTGTLRTRLLHPLERELLTTEAYGYLLDVYRLGLIGEQEFEQVLEQCSGLTRLPATREQAQAMVQRVLAEQIAAQGFGTSH